MRREAPGATSALREESAAPSRRKGLLCRLGCHEASGEGMFHGAAFHSQCRGCGVTMVRRGACWSVTAPKR